jgi:hypothetical protein
MAGNLLINFIGPLEEESLQSLFPDKSSRLRSLPASFFRRSYPIEKYDSQSGTKKKVVIKPLVQNSDKIIVGLLWTACFGRNFRVYHWNLLFDILLRTLSHDRTSRALMLILRLTATSKDARDFSTKLDPVNRVVGRKVEKIEQQSFMETLLSSLPYRLPKKDPKIDTLLDIQISSLRVRPPLIPQRKRGYNDKGTLRDETRPELVPSVEFEELEKKEDVFELLLRQTDSVVSKLQSDG